MSSVDWPNKLVATVFCQGCPWACPYCHNHAIIDPRLPGVVSWSRVEDLLSRRRGLLDGVVFSGGEATRQWPLIPAAQRVRELGFAVGLHTAGPYPARVAQLLDAGLLDWVGIDIKAMPGRAYEVASGRRGVGGETAWETLRILLTHNEVDHEVRVTVWPQGPRDAVTVAQHVRQMGARSFALQQARSRGAPQGFEADASGWTQEVRSCVEQIREIGFETFTFRGPDPLSAA